MSFWAQPGSPIDLSYRLKVSVLQKISLRLNFLLYLCTCKCYVYVCLFTSVWECEQRVNMEALKTDVGSLPQLLSDIEATEAVELSWTQSPQIWLVYLFSLFQGSSFSIHFLSTGILGNLPPGIYVSSGNPNFPIFTPVWQALHQPSYPSFSTSCKSFALCQELCALVCTLQ